MSPGLRETWEVRKPLVRSAGGVVSSQHYTASEIGARVLSEGGNAVDAAVTTGLALGAVEPWMSGLGGCGQMIVHLAGEERAWSVDFGLVASRSLDPGDYPLDEGRGSDLFHWPAVRGDRNVMGPLSIAVPTYVAGIASALERFGTRSFEQCVAPAVELAERGLDADWYATLKIASTAARLAIDEECRRVYLPNGFPPCAEWGGPPPRLRLGRLAETLAQLRRAGPRDFYEGGIARSLVADAGRLGARLTAEDLAGVEVRVREAPAIEYAGARVYAAPGLTGGASLGRALGLLGERLPADLARERVPDRAIAPHSEAAVALAFADALSTTYTERLARLGHDAEAGSPACTTHLSVADREGNLVALTQTLLSLFGSRVMFPTTGVLMNNGIMWFDPRPGRPNSIAAARRPLSNMCPVVVDRGDGDRFALGASGGRRIMPAVAQLVSFLVDFGLDLDEAVHAPRIDASGGEQVSVDPRFPPEVASALGERFPIGIHPNGVYPVMYACPNTAGALRDGSRVGAAYVMSPWALAAPAPPEGEGEEPGAVPGKRKEPSNE